jgi:hypothetical protein
MDRMAIATQRRKQAHQFKETERADPYRSRRKSAGLVRCPVCGSMNARGRWTSPSLARPTKQTAAAKKPLREVKCPACRQIEDRFAQSVVELRGGRWREKRELVENTIRHTERIARVGNDQERVLWTKDLGEVTKVYVSLPGLARRIGRELEKSFQGVVEYERSTEEPFMRVRWWSDLPNVAHRAGASLGIKRQSKAPRGQFDESAHRSKSFRGRGRT